MLTNPQPSPTFSWSVRYGKRRWLDFDYPREWAGARADEWMRKTCEEIREALDHGVDPRARSYGGIFPR